MDSSRPSLDHSFGDADSLADMNSVISGGGSYMGHHIDCNPVKKLSETFESCVKDDCLKVYLRIRPISKHTESTITVDSENTITTIAPDSSKRAAYTKQESRHYMFSRVFPPTAAQPEVFEHSTRPLLTRFLAGENCVLFAYGMTNAGKTHTIQGTSQQPGLLPRLVSSILDEMEKHKRKGDEWVLQASMLEIYQENIYDLLGKKKSKMTIRDGSGRVDVPKLSVHGVVSTEDAFKLLDSAASNRSKASTFLNNGSSRSHAVYTLTLHRPGDAGGDPTSVAFQLVDLAGAERSNRTKATAAQQKEANNINTSLMQLWRCLHAIKRKNNDLNGSMEVIPFRESKLTHLLMPILSRAGMAGVSMIACVNPQVDDYDETLSILSNASLASKIREFSDVGRTAGQAAVPTSLLAPPPPPVQVPVHAPPPASGPKMISLEDLKDFRDKHPAPLTKKRSRQESMVGTAAPAPAAAGKVPRNTRASNLGVNHILQNIQNVAAAVPPPPPVAHAAPKALADSADEIELLKKELASLRDINRQLMLQSMARETTIREEVSKEMAARSQQLLEDISKLRRELYDRETAEIGDITKSCKKARKAANIEETERNLTRALDEAEDELERIKEEHDEEIEGLRAENENLKREIVALKRLHNLPTHEVVQECVQRVVKKEVHTNDENSEVHPNATKAALIQKSPQRSPLSPIKNAENVSPMQEEPVELVQKIQKPVHAGHGFPVSSLAKARPVKDTIKVYGNGPSPQYQASSSASPQRLRGFGENVPYFTRLRSHFAR